MRLRGIAHSATSATASDVTYGLTKVRAPNFGVGPAPWGHWKEWTVRSAGWPYENAKPNWGRLRENATIQAFKESGSFHICGLPLVGRACPRAFNERPAVRSVSSTARVAGHRLDLTPHLTHHVLSLAFRLVGHTSGSPSDRLPFSFNTIAPYLTPRGHWIFSPSDTTRLAVLWFLAIHACPRRFSQCFASHSDEGPFRVLSNLSLDFRGYSSVRRFLPQYLKYSSLFPTKRPAGPPPPFFILFFFSFFLSILFRITLHAHAGELQ